MFRSPHPLLALVVAALLAPLLPAGPAAAQQVDGMSSSAVYRYELSEDGNALETTISLEVTNTKPNRSTRSGTTQYYFTGFFLAIPADVADLTITQSGTELEFETEELDEFAQMLDFSFRRNLFYRQTASIEISYTLADGSPRGDTLERWNAAQIGVELWTAPSIDEVSSEFVLPPGFEVQTYYVGGSLSSQTDEDGREVVRIDTLGGEEGWYGGWISLANEDGYTERVVSEDPAIRIRSWPGDDEWADFVADTIDADLDRLVELIGQDWPLDDELVIVESIEPYFSGYGGWYDADTATITIGDELDRELLLHELAHVWFHRDFSPNRFVTEGLADAIAGLIVDSDAPAVSLLDEFARPLLDWRFATDPDIESWGYDASRLVADEIIDEIGTEAMTDVINAVAERELAYVGETEPETLDESITWRHYLDLLEERGDTDELTELFEDWVVADRFLDELEERAAARAGYDELETRGDTWAVPLGIRRAMGDWDFETAEQQFAVALDVLDERDRMLVALDGVEVAIPDDVERAYQDAETELADVLSDMTELADGAEELRSIHALAALEPSWRARVGLIGVDPDVPVVMADAAFADGDVDGVAAAADAQRDLLDRADADGRIRVGGAAGLLVVLLGLAVVLVGRRRRNRDDGGVPSEGVDADTSPDGDRSDDEVDEGVLTV